MQLALDRDSHNRPRMNNSYDLVLKYKTLTVRLIILLIIAVSVTIINNNIIILIVISLIQLGSGRRPADQANSWPTVATWEYLFVHRSSFECRLSSYQRP